jgi:hypothetical protein
VINILIQGVMGDFNRNTRLYTMGIKKRPLGRFDAF